MRELTDQAILQLIEDKDSIDSSSAKDLKNLVFNLKKRRGLIDKDFRADLGKKLLARYKGHLAVSIKEDRHSFSFLFEFFTVKTVVLSIFILGAISLLTLSTSFLGKQVVVPDDFLQKASAYYEQQTTLNQIFYKKIVSAPGRDLKKISQLQKKNFLLWLKKNNPPAYQEALKKNAVEALIISFITPPTVVGEIWSSPKGDLLEVSSDLHSKKILYINLSLQTEEGRMDFRKKDNQGSTIAMSIDPEASPEEKNFTAEFNELLLGNSLQARKNIITALLKAKDSQFIGEGQDDGKPSVIFSISFPEKSRSADKETFSLSDTSPLFKIYFNPDDYHLRKIEIYIFINQQEYHLGSVVFLDEHYVMDSPEQIFDPKKYDLIPIQKS